MTRHYGMDWLRIGAFAILILYHIAMVFVPWDFHVKAAVPVDWATVPMLFVSPWRLTLLFLVSGYASRALLVRAPALGDFVRGRSARLLIPLIAGIVVIVPPQAWVELATQHGYAAGFAHFWLNDYFRFDTLDGTILPTWNHLWFVLYLWVYTMALAVLLLLVPGRARLQAAFDRLCAGPRALWLPVAWLLATQAILFQRWTDTHDLIGDGVAHLAYFPAFLFGFALARSEPVMAALVRWWRVSAGLALAGYAVTVAVEVRYPGATVPPRWTLDVMLWARQLQGWMSIAALIGLADAYLNRDHRWRPVLTEAVFPFYIIHQTAIVLVAYWLMPLRLGAAIECGILIVATVAACWAFYLAGRGIGWLRSLIGLRRTVAALARSATTPALT